MEREITEEYLEELFKLCSKEPQRVVDILSEALEKDIEPQLISKSYRFLSIAYFFLKEDEKELYCVNKAIETAVDKRSEILGYNRRGGYFYNLGKFLNAYLNYSKSIQLFEEFQVNDISLLVKVKMNLLLLYRSMNSNFIMESIMEEIENLKSKVELPSVIANFYWIKGIWSFENKRYKEAIIIFKKAIKLFNKLGMDYEEKQVYPKIAISMYKLNLKGYKKYILIYLNYLKKQKSELNTRLIIGLCMVNVNPFIFMDVSLKDYLKVILGLKKVNAYHNLTQLYQYLGEYYSKINEKSEAIKAYENYFKFKNFYDQEREEKLQIELLIKEETTKILNRKSTQVSYPLPIQMNVIQEFVHGELDSKVLDQLPGSNESVITQLLVKEFLQKIPINTSDGTIFLEVSQVAMLKAEGSYVIFIDKDKKRYTSSRNLAHYQRVLDPKIFLRIHHSYIINRNYLQKLYHGKAGKIELTNGLEAEVSVRKSSSIKKILLNQN